MKTVEVTNLDFFENEIENILLSQLDKTKNFDVVFALIKPREILKEHLHSRPNSGDEIFLFHKGGKFKVKNGTSIKLFDTKNPILIRFNSLEPHSIINRLDSELTFFAFYSPPFEHNEVKSLS